MKDFKSHFRFSKQERNGIFFLLLLIVVLQLSYFLIKTQSSQGEEKGIHDVASQHLIDSLKRLALTKNVPKIYPFNPNFITDYKGYTLGMSPKEIDRLLKFREEGKYVNSATEFQEITQVSDSLLSSMSIYFKFPEWTQKRNNTYTPATIQNKKRQSVAPKEIIDLNQVTPEQLKKVYGIGDKLSARIVKFRDRLGGFLVNEQLYDVYGLDSQVVKRILKRYQVLNPPKIKRINVNTATASEIAQLIYINRSQAEEIVRYREENGSFSSLNEMTSMFNVSKEKIDRIGLYLSFEEE